MTTTNITTEAVAGAAHEAASGGMPQLDPSHFPNQIFWLLLTLVVIYFVLSRVALPRIAGTIATRQYTSQRPRFAFFALAAAACWLTAVALKLALPQFQKLP